MHNVWSTHYASFFWNFGGIHYIESFYLRLVHKKLIKHLLMWIRFKVCLKYYKEMYILQYLGYRNVAIFELLLMEWITRCIRKEFRVHTRNSIFISAWFMALSLSGCWWCIFRSICIFIINLLLCSCKLFPYKLKMCIFDPNISLSIIFNLRFL